MIEIEHCPKCNEGKRIDATCFNCFPPIPTITQRAKLIYKEIKYCKGCRVVIDNKNDPFWARLKYCKDRECIKVRRKLGADEHRAKKSEKALLNKEK